MKKRVVWAFFIIMVLTCSIVLGANENNSSGTSNDLDKIDNGYKCLEDQIKNKESLSLQDAVFGILALGSDKKLKDKIDQEKKGTEACWPRSECAIKDSAQVLLAYDKTGGDKDSVKNWLLTKTQNAKDLIWYLEMDIQSHQNSECTLKYDSSEKKIKVREDMKLEGNPGNCFEISYGGYWLKVNSNCLDKEFEISCDQDFVSALVYQKSGGQTVFVSSETSLTSGGGVTREKVNSKCFSVGNKCDYESTLWAAAALSKNGENTGAYIPYLAALAGENQKYLPSALLYILTNGNDMYSELIQNQKQGKYWNVVGSPYNKFYDTALAMLALGGSGAAEFESAQNYLLSVQTKEGCWNNNNIRDSAFILYSGWPRAGQQGPGPGPGPGELCKSAGYYCETESDCLDNSGSVLNEFQCANFREVCCTKNIVESTCDEKKGLICSSNQKCTGRTEPSSDGSCCLEGACENLPTENQCAIAGGICKTSCLDSEEKSSENCPVSGNVCCMEKINKPSDKSGGISSIWIILLVVFIILVILSIIYRHRLQIWWYGRKGGKNGKSDNMSSGPRLPPGSSNRMIMQRPMPRYGPPGQRGPVRGGPMLRTTKGVRTPQDKEIEETMKKLKEMSG